MATLSKRATPRQAAVLRMIEGACRNAAHAHPEWNIPDRFARSVAKRAAGTLTSAWGSVLAASAVRQDGGNASSTSPSACGDNLASHSKRGLARVPLQAPLHRISLKIGRKAGEARRAGELDRLAGFVEALRIVAAEMKKADRQPDA